MIDFEFDIGLFQAQAQILKAPREELVGFLDIPLVPAGDLYYIQNLIAMKRREIEVAKSPHGFLPFSSRVRQAAKPGLFFIVCVLGLAICG